MGGVGPSGVISEDSPPPLSWWWGGVTEVVQLQLLGGSQLHGTADPAILPLPLPTLAHAGSQEDCPTVGAEWMSPPPALSSSCTLTSHTGVEDGPLCGSVTSVPAVIGP